MSTSRTPYIGITPDRSTFEAAVPLSPYVSYIPAPTTSNSPSSSRLSSAYEQGWRRLARLTTRPREVLESNLGLLLVASSQLFFSLMNVGVKRLAGLDRPVPAVELILVRMGITWLCCVSYMYIMKVPDPILGPKGVRYFLVQRGAFGFLGIFGLYYSLQYLSLSDATVLQFLSPMFTAIAGAVFLREVFSWREASAGLASLVGVMLIARPTFLFGSAHHEPTPPDAGDLLARVMDEKARGVSVTPPERLMAVGVALIGAVGAAGAYTTIRHIGKRAHALHNLVAYSALCVIVTTVAMIAMRIPVVVPTRWDWLLTLFGIGIAGFGGQVLLTLGLQRETAGRGSIAVYGQIVFATVFERIFFHAYPSPLSIFGTLIIICSALYVVLTKQAKTTGEAVAVTSDDPSVAERLLDNATDDDADDAAENGYSVTLSENSQSSFKVPSK